MAASAASVCPSAPAPSLKLCLRLGFIFSRLLDLRQPCLGLFFCGEIESSDNFPSLTSERSWGSRGDSLCLPLPAPLYKQTGVYFFGRNGQTKLEQLEATFK